jgi:hypothetical protein
MRRAHKQLLVVVVVVGMFLLYIVLYFSESIPKAVSILRLGPGAHHDHHGHEHHNKSIIDEEKLRSDPRASAVEYFETLARLGGDRWLNLETGMILGENSYVLAEIVVNTTIEHLLRPNPLPADFATPPSVQVDCLNPDYANVLTGQKDPKQKFVVDIALFGFDVDLLEIRLLELSDLVDVFVVPEQSKTFKGIPKPMQLVPKLLKGRLERFRDKVDYYFDDVSYIQLSSQWEIEFALRSNVMKYVIQKYGNSTTTEVYFVQNDGDEIIERTAMAHFKECELKPPTGEHDRLFFPSICFKRNVAWVVETYDMKQLILVPVQQNVSDMRNYLWRLGPTIQHISAASQIISNIRGVSYSPSDYHMGLGSANHFSSPVDPKLAVVKAFSTVDSAPYFQNEAFWKKAIAGNLTYNDIQKVLLICQTEGEPFQWLPTNSLDPTIQKYVLSHLPWAVRKRPYRYQWLYHGDEYFASEKKLYDATCNSY